mmetsp:Transcript_13504/g.17280  ORF Transcript_13504/g.17280 Transcript_13504/m.17280 type:complete len:246 (+) Transcript_13504:3-740(+)
MNSRFRVLTFASYLEGSTCTSAKEVCSSNSDCCTGACSSKGKCKCADLTEICFSDADCCEGSCSGNVCVEAVPTEAPSESGVCLDNNLTCDEDSDCCSGYCNNKNKCKDAPVVTTGTPTPAPTSTPAGDCSGFCGCYSFSGYCWCDDWCSFYGDCCADVCDTCGLSCVTKVGKIAKVMDRPEDFDPELDAPYTPISLAKREKVQDKDNDQLVKLLAGMVSLSGLLVVGTAYYRRKVSHEGYSAIP